MRHFPKPVLICLLALAFTTYQPSLALESKTKDIRPSPLAKIPIQVVANRIHVTLYSGDHPLQVLLDTGATSSIFFEGNDALKHNFEHSEQEENQVSIAFPAIDQSVKGIRLKALNLHYENFTFTSKRALLLKSDTPVAAMLEAEFDAILGQEFFRAFTVEIDPAHQIMNLYAAGTDLREYHETSHRLYMEGHTPHIRFYSKMPWERRGTSKAMLLDTGYPGSMVLWSKRHYNQAVRSGQTVTHAEDSAGIVSHIKLRFGELFFENIPVFIASSVPQQSLKRDGLIGASILAQHRHVIDFAQSRLFMTPLLGSTGRPLQIIDGMIYTPNNENFELKTFYPKVPIHPTLVIHATGNRGEIFTDRSPD